MTEPTQEPRFFLDQNMETGEIHEVPSGQAGVYSRRSPEKESANEDAAVLIRASADSIVLAVADGVGSSFAGEHASSLAVRALEDSVKDASAEEDGLRDAIVTGIERANEAIVSLGVGAGTTLAVVLVQGETIRTFHVGDSMILVVSQQGRTKMQTISHSPVGYALEAGVLDEKEAIHHDERHVISNLVGTPDMRIEIGPALQMAARDTLLLASDGVFDNLLVEEVAKRIRKGPLRKVVSSLAESCLQRMSTPQEGQPSKTDDLTFIVFRRKIRRKNQG